MRHPHSDSRIKTLRGAIVNVIYSVYANLCRVCDGVCGTKGNGGGSSHRSTGSGSGTGDGDDLFMYY